MKTVLFHLSWRLDRYGKSISSMHNLFPNIKKKYDTYNMYINSVYFSFVDSIKEISIGNWGGKPIRQ